MDDLYRPINKLPEQDAGTQSGVYVWEPIETAPKDGSDVLLFYPHYKHQIQVGCYVIEEKVQNGKVIERDEYWKGKWMDYRFIRLSFDSRDEPTYWAPLPAITDAMNQSDEDDDSDWGDDEGFDDEGFDA